MAEHGRLLLADNEESFVYSTASLLRAEGYRCDIALDASSAAAMIREDQHDLLICDVCLPGNRDMELIRSLPQLVRGMPAILLTGHPSLESAARCVGLPVIAYLTKPIDLDELLRQIRRAVRCHHAYRAIAATRARLQEWYKDLENMQLLLENSPLSGTDLTVDTYMALTLRHACGFLLDLRQLGDDTPLATTPFPADEAGRLAVGRNAAELAIHQLEHLRAQTPAGQMEDLRAYLAKVARVGEKSED